MLPPCVTTKAVVPSCRRRAIDSHIASCCRAKRRACSLPPMSSRTSCRERIVSYCCCVRASSGEPARNSRVSSTRPAISTAVARARARGLLMTRANSPAVRRRPRAAAMPGADKPRPDPSSLPGSAWRRISNETIAVLLAPMLRFVNRADEDLLWRDIGRADLPRGETNPPTRRTNLPGLGRPEEERRSPEVLEAALEQNRRGRARVGDEPGERASLTGRTIHSVLDKRGVHAVPAGVGQ